MPQLAIAKGGCHTQVSPAPLCSGDQWCRLTAPACASGRKRPAVPEVRGSTGSPTVRRRELGALLRALRTERGLTVDQVAGELLCSPSKVRRMETGQCGATPRDIRDLRRHYGVTDPVQQGGLTRLAATGKRQGWWRGYVLDCFAAYVGLEEEVVVLSYYQSSVVPGRLQTTTYVRVIHDIGIPPVMKEPIPAQASCTLLERPQDLARYRGVFEQLRAKAPTPQESIALHGG